RVPAHRVQHVVAAHAPGARQDVGGGVPLGMTDVQTDAGRVGEHVEDVAFGPADHARGAERPVLVPVALPARIDLEVVVGHVLLYPVVAVPPSVREISTSILPAHLTPNLDRRDIALESCRNARPCQGTAFALIVVCGSRSMRTRTGDRYARDHTA